MPAIAKAARDQLVTEIIDLRLAGATLPAIQKHVSERGFQLAKRNVQRLINRAEAIIAERATENRDRTFARHVARREMLFARCLKAQDFATALKVLRDECQLLGLYPEPKPAGRNGDGPDSRMAVIVGLLPELRAAMASISSGAGSPPLAIPPTGDAAGVIQHEPETVPRTVNDSGSEGSGLVG
jgi:hypothetical protein